MINVRYQFMTKDGKPNFPAIKKEMANIKKDIANAQLLLLIKSKDLSEQATYFMAQRIRARTKRPSQTTGFLISALQDSVRVTRSRKYNFVITVGKQSTLPDYWAMLNYGGRIKSGPVPGKWSNGKKGRSVKGGAGKGAFTYKKGGGNRFGYMNPMKPIKGIHYIMYAHVKMLAWVNSRFSMDSIMKRKRSK